MRTGNTLRVALAACLGTLPAVAVGQGLPPIEREFPNGSTATFYGQINKGILQYDDGEESETYGLIDNNNSGTRFGLAYTRDFGDWTFENVNEFQYAPFSTANASILQQSPPSSAYDWSNSNIRKLDFTFTNERYGKFWIGQGSMATDGITEIDLSGTGVIAYSSVADSAAGQLLRQSDGTLSDIEIGSLYANFDGDRRVRVRYDMRAFNNFTLAASYGRDLLSDDADTRERNLADASVAYSNTFADTVELAAGVGYYWQEDNAQIWGASASALHTPTGLNLTLSAANQNVDEGTDGTYWYGKLGLLREFVDWGDTAASIDYYSGDDIFVDDATGATSSTSDSWGVALVQNIDRANTQLWLTYRSYDFSDDAESYDDGSAIFGGARFSF